MRRDAAGGTGVDKLMTTSLPLAASSSVSIHWSRETGAVPALKISTQSDAPAGASKETSLMRTAAAALIDGKKKMGRRTSARRFMARTHSINPRRAATAATSGEIQEIFRKGFFALAICTFLIVIPACLWRKSSGLA